MRDLNVKNFRDISGYTNKYGETMLENKIFRGGPLDEISKEDARYMEDILGIQYILDYRDEKEASLKPNIDFPTAKIKRIGALKVKDAKDEGFDFGEMMKQEITLELLQTLREYVIEGYKTMAFDNEAYQLLFDLLLENNGHIYFHCSAGKDRTGVSAFLIMIALGMSEEDAIEEYMLSDKMLQPWIQKTYEEHQMTDEVKEIVQPLLSVQRESIETTIKSIKDRYGNYDKFLLEEYGLDNHKRETLRSLYCDKK